MTIDVICLFVAASGWHWLGKPTLPCEWALCLFFCLHNCSLSLWNVSLTSFFSPTVDQLLCLFVVLLHVGLTSLLTLISSHGWSRCVEIVQPNMFKSHGPFNSFFHVVYHYLLLPLSTPVYQRTDVLNGVNPLIEIHGWFTQEWQLTYESAYACYR